MAILFTLGKFLPEICREEISEEILFVFFFCCLTWVVCWLIRRKARVQTPGQTLKRKYFFDDFLSSGFWQKL